MSFVRIAFRACLHTRLAANAAALIDDEDLLVAARERDAAALKTALREQESQHQHLVTLEGQRNALRSEVAELTQRIEQTQRAKQQREQELLDELRRQREHYESLRETSAPLYPSPVNRPTPPEPPPWVPQSGSSTVRSPEPSAYAESRVERSPAEPPRLAKPPKPSVRAEPASQKDERSHGKPEPPRRVPKWPRIEQFAERTMRRRMPEYIKLQRPDLKRDLQYELTGGEGPLHNVARLLSRLIFVGLSRGQAAGDVDLLGAGVDHRVQQLFQLGGLDAQDWGKAAITLLGPAMSRLFIPFPDAPPFSWLDPALLADLFFVALIVHDRRTLGRVHVATLVVTVLIVGSHWATYPLKDSAWWNSHAPALARFHTTAPKLPEGHR